MKKNKKFIILVIFFVSIFFIASQSFDYVRADDDEQEEREDDEEDYDDEKSESSLSSERELAQTTSVSKSVETVILKDTDGDGLLDKDDPHPNMAEIYIVEDGNRNGIVDKFEK